MKTCNIILGIFFPLTFFSFKGFSQTTGAYSQTTFDSLKKLIQQDKEDTIKVHHLVQISNTYLPVSADTSVLYAQKALELAQKINFIRGILFAEQNLVEGLRLSGNFPLALDNAFKSLSLAKKIKDPVNISIANAYLGEFYYDIGDYNTSLKFYRENLRTAEYMSGVYYAWTNMSHVYHSLGQADSAMLYAKMAYKRSTNFDDTLFISDILGDAFFDKAKYDSALFQYKITIRLSIPQNDKLDKVDAYNGIAAVYHIKNHFDSAVLYSKKVVDEKISKSYPLGLLKAVNMLADIYSSQNKTDSSLKYLRIAITIKDSLFSREKTFAIQNLSYKEQEKQKAIDEARLQLQNRVRMYALLAGLFVAIIIAIILFKNNRQKQKASKKIEIAYAELKSTQAQLIQSEKMASLGELTAGIAHEIQNPLNFVNNFSEVNKELIEELKIKNAKLKIEDEEVNELLNDIKDNEEKINHHGKRADAIVKGMLQHSKKTSGQKEPTDINALADEYLRLTYHGMRAKDKSFNATLNTDFDETIGLINIIPQDTSRVLLNLYNNAFYAVNEKAKQQPNGYEPTISVSTKRSVPSLSSKWTPLEERGWGEVILTVTDNGNGIPQNIIDKIFQPFFTTKPTGQGTGLGLSLSYDIIKAHGGEIKVETKEGEGTEFIFKLPINS